MWFLQKQFFFILIFLFLSELQAYCCNTNDKSFICLFKANESKNCDCVEGYQTEVDLLFNDVPHDLHEKLLIGSLADFTAEEIINLPTSLIYFLPINKLAVLSGNHLASLIIAHEDHTPIAKKVLQSIKTDQQRIEFLNFLVTKVITNNKILDFIGETVYKWNYDVKDGKFQKLSNICGYALARLWTPYVLTTTKTISTRLLTLLAEVEQKQKQRILCNKFVQFNWKNLPKSVRRLWSFLSVNQSFPNPLTKWTVQQTALQYTFLLPDFNNNELFLIPFDELSKNALYDVDFDISQARFLFSMLMENSTLKDMKILYPTFFSKLSPLQIDKFKPEEWANETAIYSFEKTHLSYPAAKQIFNKIASDRLSKKHINGYYKWTSDDLRHLPLIYTQPATSFLKFCATPPSIQSFIAVDSYMLTNRQAFYLSGCSSILSFPSNDPKLLLDLKYMINKAVPVSSLLYINNGNINYPLMSHLVSLIDDHNMPMAFYLLNITNPVKQTCFIKEMLNNKHNILFDQLAPSDIPGPIFDVLKQLYSNYTDRIDKLPKHILNVILENNDLLLKWNGNDSAFTKGLYNGYTCNFIRRLNSVNFIILISNYNAYLKQNGKVFPKNLQVCVAEAFINYLKFKSKLTADSDIHLDAWEVEAVQGFVLTTLPIDVIVNSNLSDNILYSIGQLSFPELMIASQPQKLSLMVDKYITNILENRSTLSFEHLHVLGNLIHFIPTIYLSVIDEQAFKFMVESGLIDTRICVDSIAKEKWADLLIKAFGNVENWSSDTLVTLSDLLIVLNQDQLNAIPDMSRLNSSDIILTRYADEIEFLSDNIPFYKGCVLILGDQYKDFTNSLSTLINFYLTSMQIQLQMISPINYNLNDPNKKVISSEVKGKMYKPNVLISLPKSDDIDKLSLNNNMFNKYFGGKEKQDVNDSLNIKKNIQVKTTLTEEEIINTLAVNQQISVTKNSTLILDIENSTTSSPILSSLNSSRYDLSLKNIRSDQDIEKPFDETFLPLLSTTNNHKKLSNNKNNTEYEIQLAIDDSKLIINAIHLQGVVENRKIFHDDFKTNVYNITSNQSLLSEIVEISTMKNNKTFNGQQKKRSLKLFFDTEVQVSCEALKMLGPASVTYLQFDSIIHSMSDAELDNCVDLLGSFDINPELARHIWSRTKEKTALHTYGSVLSGLSVNDIKMLDLSIDRPWSLELIHLLSEYVKTDKIGEEIIKQFFTKSKANMPSHLWGSFGSLICKLPPRIFKIIMPNKELFWKTSSAFNTIKSCDMSCISNLASIAISVIGQSNTWKTAEVERMGIILSGINITQWQLLLNLNPKALEGLSSNTVKCLNEQQIKLMDGSHMKYLTPKSANALLENHSELLDFQTKETLLQLVNFEIKIDYSINVFESRNDYSIEMQAHSKAPVIQVLYLSILGAIIIVFYLNIIV
uniref:Otoancorin n=1 Tax=Schizaphis graminum TaxID=13262 RepID=A0A2S2NSI1_SCHGA